MITIIIPTFNRYESLEKVIHSYLCQGDCVEKIIIWDDCSELAIFDNIKKLISDNSIKKIEVFRNKIHIGAQLTKREAVKHVFTQFVLFGEDDVWLEKDYCNILLNELNVLNADVIGGRLIDLKIEKDSDFTQKILIEDTQPASLVEKIYDNRKIDAKYGSNFAEPFPVFHLHAIALFKHKDIIDCLFDSYYSTGNGYREETEMYINLSKQKKKIFITPSTKCYHLRGYMNKSGGARINRLSVEYFNLKNTWYLIKKHWIFLREYDFTSFSGTPFLWMLRFIALRYQELALKFLKNGLKSSFDG